MLDYTHTNMYTYIKETPDTLLHILKNHEEITKSFVQQYKDVELHQFYIVGSGTSYHAGLAAKSLLEEIFQMPVRCAYPIPFKNQEFIDDKHTLVIGVSQGGQSYSTVYGLDGAKEKGVYTAALSANKEARIFSHSQVSTLLEVGDEKCGAKTKGYCATILTLMLMGMDLANAKGILTKETYEHYIKRMKRVIQNQQRIIEKAEQWYADIHSSFIDTNRVIVVGYDHLYADVLEGSLKILETVRVGVEGYELEEFMHGIYNSVNEQTHIFYLGSASPYKERLELLQETMSSLTPHNYMISTDAKKKDSHNLICDFVDDELFSNWEYILPLQIVSCIAPVQKGVNPDIPKDPNFHAKMKSK